MHYLLVVLVCCTALFSKWIKGFRLPGSVSRCAWKTQQSTNNAADLSITCAEIEALLDQRNYYRQLKQYEEADSIRDQLKSMNIGIVDQIGWKTSWQHISAINEDQFEQLETVNIMNLIDHMYLSDCVTADDIALIKKTLEKYRNVQDDSPSRWEMHGRKFADAAFSLALAGVVDNEIFHSLADHTQSELMRFGRRRSCTSVIILQMMEKLVIAGIPSSHPVYQTAISILQNKSDNPATNLRPEMFEYSNPRCLRWLWRYAGRHDKAPYQVSKDKQVENSTESQYKLNMDLMRVKQTTSDRELTGLFRDNSLPSVIDIGCGYGTTLLRLAQQSHHGRQHNAALGTHYDINYLGIDMNKQGIKYASGIVSRWGVSSTCRFLAADVFNVLDSLKQQPSCGNIALIMVNFPTPFQFEEGRGNRQLPERSDFLVRSALLEAVCALLDAHDMTQTILLLQSNAEDVAVEMKRSMADFSTREEDGNNQRRFQIVSENELMKGFGQLFPFYSIDLKYSSESDVSSLQPTKRDEMYRKGLEEKVNDNDQRAWGRGYVKSNPLPFEAMSETEAAYKLDGKNIYRLAYVYK